MTSLSLVVNRVVQVQSNLSLLRAFYDFTGTFVAVVRREHGQISRSEEEDENESQARSQNVIGAESLRRTEPPVIICGARGTEIRMDSISHDCLFLVCAQYIDSVGDIARMACVSRAMHLGIKRLLRPVLTAHIARHLPNLQVDLHKTHGIPLCKRIPAAHRAKKWPERSAAWLLKRVSRVCDSNFANLTPFDLAVTHHRAEGDISITASFVENPSLDAGTRRILAGCGTHAVMVSIGWNMDQRDIPCMIFAPMLVEAAVVLSVYIPIGPTLALRDAAWVTRSIVSCPPEGHQNDDMREASVHEDVSAGLSPREFVLRDHRLAVTHATLASARLYKIRPDGVSLTAFKRGIVQCGHLPNEIVAMLATHPTVLELVVNLPALRRELCYHTQ